MKKILRPVAATAVICVTLAQGCTSFVPAEQDRPLVDQVVVGHQVRVTSSDGAQNQFTVTKVDENGLYGEELYFRFDEISHIEISAQSEEGKLSAGTVALIVLGVILVLDGLGVGDAD